MNTIASLHQKFEQRSKTDRFPEKIRLAQKTAFYSGVAGVLFTQDDICHKHSVEAATAIMEGWMAELRQFAEEMK